MSRPAIGYIRHAHASPADLPKLRDLITNHAAAHGLQLHTIYEAEVDVFMPMILLLNKFQRTGAEVIVAPTLEHVWDQRRAITLHADMAIAASGEIYPKGIEWSPWNPGERSFAETLANTAPLRLRAVGGSAHLPA